MARITRTIKGTTYVYEVNHYWDKVKKQSRNRQVLIGKIDKDTGQIIHTRKRQPPSSQNSNANKEVLSLEIINDEIQSNPPAVISPELNNDTQNLTAQNLPAQNLTKGQKIFNEAVRTAGEKIGDSINKLKRVTITFNFDQPKSKHRKK